MKEKNMEYRLALEKQIHDRKRLADEEKNKAKREAAEEDLRIKKEVALLAEREEAHRLEEEKKRTKYAQTFLARPVEPPRKPRPDPKDQEQPGRGQRHQQEVRRLIEDRPESRQSRNYKQYEPAAYHEIKASGEEEQECAEEDVFPGLDTIGSFEADDRMNIRMRLNTDLSRKYVLSQMEERRKDMGLQEILSRNQTPDPTTYSKDILENRQLRHVLSRASTKHIQDEFQNQLEFLKQTSMGSREKEQLISRGRDALDEFAEGLIANNDPARQAPSRQMQQTRDTFLLQTSPNQLMAHTHQTGFRIDPMYPQSEDSKRSPDQSRQATRNGFFESAAAPKRNFEELVRATHFSNDTSNNFFLAVDKQAELRPFGAAQTDKPSLDVGLKVPSPDPDAEQLHPHELLREAAL